jgi:hypothetical protein
LLELHVSTFYAAMFDEVDEGTALFMVAARSNELPIGATMVDLGEDGCDLPRDWYLKITGVAHQFLASGAVPPTQLEQALQQHR